MLKEELTRVKDKLHKIEKVNSCRTDEREPLKKGNGNTARSK